MRDRIHKALAVIISRIYKALKPSQKTKRRLVSFALIYVALVFLTAEPNLMLWEMWARVSLVGSLAFVLLWTWAMARAEEMKIRNRQTEQHDVVNN